VQRQGEVRAIVVPDSSGATLGGTLTQFVLPESTIYTDEWHSYIGPGARYKAHLRIQHKQNIYVNGSVHTNTIEGFFSLVKSGLRASTTPCRRSGFRAT
jgi:transposase